MFIVPFFSMLKRNVTTFNYSKISFKIQERNMTHFGVWSSTDTFPLSFKPLDGPVSGHVVYRGVFTEVSSIPWGFLDSGMNNGFS